VLGNINQSITIMGQKLGQQELARADVVIRPQVLEIGAADFEQRHNAILQGEKRRWRRCRRSARRSRSCRSRDSTAANAAATAKARAEEAARIKAQCAQADKGWTSMLKRDDPACAGATN
jgi:NTE family protein